MNGLRGLRVVDWTRGIAGGYCTRLFADAGADVVKVEPPSGDPLRRWSATGAPLGDRDGALFRFLHASKRSVVAEPGSAEADALLTGADLVVEGGADDRLDPAVLREADPSGVVLSITPFGRTGPWAKRPATEFTLQAESGSIGGRGVPGREPFQAGGRITEWVGGTFAAVAALAALERATTRGAGEWIDFSLLEVMTIASSNYLDLTFRLLGVEPKGSIQSVETPSIEPTRDGYVGFCTNSAQQFSDFLLLIGRDDLRDDRQLFSVAGRAARFDEWNEIVRAYTRRHTTAEIVEAASRLRIPVAPVNDGDRVRAHQQLVERRAIAACPDGDFLQPVPPYRIDGERPPPPQRAPKLGEHTGRIEVHAARETKPPPRATLPLEGLRVLDLTAWWAGPSATQMLAGLGADVVHIESTQRIDGMRTTGGLLAGSRPDWWEWSAFFLSANTNKRGLTLNLRDPRGVAVFERLARRADAVVENFTPRVLENFGLDAPRLLEWNPDLLVVRMPAFGLDGPWRDHTGFAQTMEQLTGLAWITGHVDDQPRIQRGPCDPLAGMHGAFALLVALAERRARGRGCRVEVAMVEGALNAAAEQLVEFTAYGRRMEREGNRSPTAAPQGLYACLGSVPGAEQWLALSVETDAQWQALRVVLGDPAWARLPEWQARSGRRRDHDAIDSELRAWAATRDRDALVEALVANGVPAGRVRDPRTTSANPQLAAREFYEPVEHPVVGTHPVAGLPFRYASVERWIRRPAPTLGQHNREILAELGLATDEVAALEDAGVIGSRPEGL